MYVAYTAYGELPNPDLKRCCCWWWWM